MWYPAALTLFAEGSNPTLNFSITNMSFLSAQVWKTGANKKSPRFTLRRVHTKTTHRGTKLQNVMHKNIDTELGIEFLTRTLALEEALTQFLPAA